MQFKKLLYTRIFFAFINVTLSKTLGSWEDNDNTLSELNWLFEIEDDKSNHAVKTKYTVCDTKPCQIIADEFKWAMNKSVDPCNDFYEYVCGDWTAHNPIPPYESGWGRFEKFQQVVFSRIKGILETEPISADILPVRQAKKWYRSCMDTVAIEKRGLKQLDSILMQVGGWPMTMDAEEWDETEHTWQSIEEHYFHITGGYAFYKITKPYGEDGVLLYTEDLPLANDVEFKYRNYSGNDYDGYVKLIEGIIKIFIHEHKADVSVKRIEKDVYDLVEFEKKLFLLEDEDFDSVTTTIDEFVNAYKGNITEIENKNKAIEKINFRRLIRRVFNMVNYEIEDSASLYASQNLEYWIKLTKILNETPKRIIVNYIHWHFVSAMIKYTSENMRDLLWQMKSDDFGITARKPRWLECVNEMGMAGAASYAFTQKYFHSHIETDVQEMIDNIRNEMRSQIKRTTWLDEESKELVIDKLNDMKVFLGYPDWFKNKTSVLNLYNGLTIGSDHFNNVLSFARYKRKRRLRDMPISSSYMAMDPTIVNAFYNPWGNAIELPAADFQPPLFTKKFPRNINYGMAGVLIGHEIGHGFDDTGIKLGKDGNETEISKHIMDMYYQRAECFLNQFNEYWGVTEADYDDIILESGEGSIGRRTRGENIADSTGLHSVYEAYQKMIKKSSKEDYKLPGFENYTDDQMFFISFGSMWCENVRPKYAKYLENIDSHSPGRLRVIGAVSNTNDFSRAFNCPKGSPMNPHNKCNIWKSSKKNHHINEIPSCYREHNYRYMNW